MQVLESTRQVARLPTSTASVPYDQMKNQCEALVVGKQEKMSVLLSLKQKNDVFRNDLIKDNEDRLTFSERVCVPKNLSVFLLFGTAISVTNNPIL